MGPTEAEGEPLVAEASGHAAAGPEDPLASFLQTVQAMVQDSPDASPPPASPVPEDASRRDRRAARKAAKQAREHEQKLVREERRSARTRGRRPQPEGPAVVTAGNEPAPVAAEPLAPSAAPQRVPAQAVEPVIDGAADSRTEQPAADEGQSTTSRRAGRRQRRQEAARAGTVPSEDPTALPEPADDDGEDAEPSEVPVEAGLAGIHFTAETTVQVRRSRGARRLDRRRQAARAVAAAVPTAELVEPSAGPAAEPPAEPSGPVEPPVGATNLPGAGRDGGATTPPGKAPRVPRRERRRERREARALRKADEGGRLTAADDGGPAAEPSPAPVLGGRARRRLRREEKAREKADRKAEAKARKADARVAKILADVDRTRARAEARAARQAPEAERPRDRVDTGSTGPDPGPDPGTPVALSSWARRREQRQEQKLATLVAQAARLGESPGRPAEAEDLADYVARVQAPRLPRRSRRSRARTPLWFRRTVKISLVVVLVAGCATLPWAAPQVPDLIAGVLPGHGTTAVRVEDPPVAPPKDAIVGPVGVGQVSGPYDGVRLEAAGWPRQVEVQRLHVDSQVVPISGQSGSLLPPSDPQVLGWWKEGRPVGAQYGTAVITGHTVHTGGGALDHLDQLVVGDSVRVRTDAGWIRYVVQRTQVYSTDRLAREAKDVFRLGGNGRLVLITCDDWDGKEYRSNAIVIATPVLDEPSAS